jgi:hypothetical protein
VFGLRDRGPHRVEQFVLDEVLHLVVIVVFLVLLVHVGRR